MSLKPQTPHTATAGTPDGYAVLSANHRDVVFGRDGGRERVVADDDTDALLLELVTRPPLPCPCHV